jgi:ubiquinone/menaquinone biosynthesis C-methylase UbiE
MAGHPLFAALCDTLMAPMEPLRGRVVAEATGTVLEIGFGTGLNLPYYTDIQSLDAVEPDPHMCARAAKRIADSKLSVTLHQVDAQSLPFADRHFDTVVCTWALCTIPDPHQALAEMMRVLKPGGKLLYAEHIASKNQPERLVQSALNPLWRVCGAGCNINRDTVDWIQEAGFVGLENQAKGWRRLNLIPVHLGFAFRPA